MEVSDTGQLFDVDDFVMTRSPFEVAVGNRKVPTTHVAWHVIEVNIQECSAGTQYWYTCRPHIPETRGRYESREFRDWAGNELRKFNQIELEAYEPPEVENEKPTSEELMQKIIELFKKGPPTDAEQAE